MPCSLPRLALTPTLPTTASTCLLRRHARLLLVHGSSGAAAAATHPVTEIASRGLACSHYTSVAASPSLRASSSSGRARGSSGLVALTVTASVAAVSACLVFFSAIHSLLACKREAEFLEKYLNSARAKLPETMASVRLVGREIGDLASDLSDLSQELTKGVKSSMRIVHTAEAQLQLTPQTRPGSLLRVSNQNNMMDEPLLVSTVRHLRELIADTRSGFGTASGIVSAIMWAFNFGSKQSKNRS